MNTKLNLTIEHTIIEKKEDNIENSDLTPIVKSLKGTFKAPKNFDYKEELIKRLKEKYL